MTKEDKKECEHKWVGNGTCTGKIYNDELMVYSAIFCEKCGKIKIKNK